MGDHSASVNAFYAILGTFGSFILLILTIYTMRHLCTNGKISCNQIRSVSSILIPFYCFTLLLTSAGESINFYILSAHPYSNKDDNIFKIIAEFGFVLARVTLYIIWLYRLHSAFSNTIVKYPFSMYLFLLIIIFIQFIFLFIKELDIISNHAEYYVALVTTVIELLISISITFAFLNGLVTVVILGKQKALPVSSLKIKKQSKSYQSPIILSVSNEQEPKRLNIVPIKEMNQTSLPAIQESTQSASAHSVPSNSNTQTTHDDPNSEMSNISRNMSINSTNTNSRDMQGSISEHVSYTYRKTDEYTRAWQKADLILINLATKMTLLAVASILVSTLYLLIWILEENDETWDYIEDTAVINYVINAICVVLSMRFSKNYYGLMCIHTPCRCHYGCLKCIFLFANAQIEDVR